MNTISTLAITAKLTSTTKKRDVKPVRRLLEIVLLIERRQHEFHSTIFV